MIETILVASATLLAIINHFYVKSQNRKEVDGLLKTALALEKLLAVRTEQLHIIEKEYKAVKAQVCADECKKECEQSTTVCNSVEQPVTTVKKSRSKKK